VDWKIADADILNEKSQIRKIGPKKKLLIMKMLSIHEYYEIFLPKFLVFLQYWDQQFKDIVIKVFEGGYIGQ